MVDVIKDFGEWNVPEKWDDVSLKTYQAIEEYYADKDRKFDVREVLHIICDKSIDEVNELPIEFAEKILVKLMFMQDKPIINKPSACIEIDGERYIVNVMEKLKTGEYVAVDAVLKNNPHDYASIFAILCRKDGEIYDSKFEAELFEKRVELFSKQPITKIMPVISFFLNLWVASTIPSRLFSEAEEGLNLIQRNIDSSENLGAFKRRSLNSQVKKLRKLLTSNKNT